MVTRHSAFLLGSLAACGWGAASVAAQQRGQNPSQQPAPITRAEPGSGAREEYAGTPEEKVSQTPHTIRLDGRDIKYTATTGTVPIRADDGKVAARMFFVAYTRENI